MKYVINRHVLLTGVCLLLSMSMHAAGQDSKLSLPTADYQVVPLPASVIPQREDGFVLNESCRIVVKDNGRDMWRNARFLQEYIAETTGMEIPASERVVKGKSIVLRLNEKMTEKEGYRIFLPAEPCIVDYILRATLRTP